MNDIIMQNETLLIGIECVGVGLIVGFLLGEAIAMARAIKMFDRYVVALERILKKPPIRSL